MSSVLTLLFAPSFLLLIHYFDFRDVVLAYIAISLLLLFYAFKKGKKGEDFIVLGIYFVILSISYFYADMLTIKFIPVLTSLTFSAIFAEAAIKKRELIYSFTKKFYKKDFSEAEVRFLKNGDGYWAVCILLFTVIQVVLTFMADDTLWALYSSVGWYLYFALCLVAQIAYGRLYAIKMSL